MARGGVNHPVGRPFSAMHLLVWVVLYALVAAGPWWVVTKLPSDFLDKPLQAGRPTTVREAATWFPATMAVAAGVTLIVGVTFGLMYTVLGMGRPWSAHATGQDARPRFGFGRVLSPSRSACGVFGILLIVGGIVGIWMAIAQDRLEDWMPTIIVAIGSGIGVATGGVYHTRD